MCQTLEIETRAPIDFNNARPCTAQKTKRKNFLTWANALPLDSAHDYAIILDGGATEYSVSAEQLTTGLALLNGYPHQVIPYR